MNGRCKCKRAPSILAQSSQAAVLNKNACSICNGQLKKPEKKALFTLEHRNGVYEGTLSGYKKEGHGVFCADDGLIYIGAWHNGAVQGEGVLFFPGGGLYFGKFEKNKLQGIGLILYRNKDIVCGFWRKSKLHGLVYKFCNDKDLWVLEEYENGNLLAYKKQERVVNKVYGFPSFVEANQEVLGHLRRLWANTLLQVGPAGPENQRRLIEKTLDEKLTYMGFAVNNIPEGLGILLDDWNMVLSGNFKDGVLEGLGRINIENGDVYDGCFQKGVFNEKGIYFSKEKNTFIFGDFFKNRCQRVIKEGSGFPIYLALNMKKKHHESSAHFYDTDFSLTSLDLPRDLFEDCFPSLSASGQAVEGKGKAEARSLTPTSRKQGAFEASSIRDSLFRGIAGKKKDESAEDEERAYQGPSEPRFGAQAPQSGKQAARNVKSPTQEHIITRVSSLKYSNTPPLHKKNRSSPSRKEVSEDFSIEEKALDYSKEQRFTPKIEGVARSPQSEAKPLSEAVQTEKSLLRLRKSMAGQLNLVESFQQKQKLNEGTISSEKQPQTKDVAFNLKAESKLMSSYMDNTQYIAEDVEYEQAFERRQTFGNEDSDWERERRGKGSAKQQEEPHSAINYEEFFPLNDAMSKYSDSSVGSFKDRNAQQNPGPYLNSAEGLFSPVRINELTSKYQNANAQDLFGPYRISTPERAAGPGSLSGSGNTRKSRIFDPINKSATPPVKRVDFEGII